MICLKVKNLTVFKQSILKSNSHFADKATSQAIILRLFKKLEDKASDAPNKFLQRHIKLEVIDELVDIEGQCPWFASKYLALFLKFWNYINLGRLKEFGYENMWSSGMQCNMSQTMVAIGCKL